MGPGALELSFLRPLGLAALVLPLALLLFARRRAEPRPVATGTFALWERIAAHPSATGPARGRRTPLATWLLALALLLGALAFAGPRLTAPLGPRTFVVLVDHAPSTALPWLTEAGPGAAGAPSRLSRALSEARAWLAAEARPGDRVRWLSSARPALVTGAAEAPGAAWLAHPDFAAPRPPAALVQGALLVTDRAPEDPPAGLGWCASGGAAVYGPVAADPEALWVWDGTEVERRPEPGAGGRAALDAELPASVRGVAQAWAGARGVELAPPGTDARLSVRAAPAGGGAPLAADVGRDGWRARASFAPGGVRAPDDGRPYALWLAAPGGAPLVWSAPGRVESGLSELAPAGGDPALFAVSWAELFDAALLPHPAVVPLMERADAGPPSRREPSLPPPEPAAAARLTRVPLDAWLAGLGALAALAALALARAS